MADQENQPQDEAEKATQEILKQAEHGLPEDEQVKLGKPLKDETGLNPVDMDFLHMLMQKIEGGEIDLHVPSSLLNEPVYASLSEEAQGKADYNAMTLLSTIRQIRQLWEMGDKDSYQIQNLVHQVRLTKERLEDVGGDIYII